MLHRQSLDSKKNCMCSGSWRMKHPQKISIDKWTLGLKLQHTFRENVNPWEKSFLDLTWHQSTCAHFGKSPLVWFPKTVLVSCCCQALQTWHTLVMSNRPRHSPWPALQECPSKLPFLSPVVYVTARGGMACRLGTASRRRSQPVEPIGFCIRLQSWRLAA